MEVIDCRKIKLEQWRVNLVKKTEKRETAFLTSFWNSILERINETSKLIQSETIDLGTTVALLKSLLKFLSRVAFIRDFTIHFQFKLLTMSYHYCLYCRHHFEQFNDQANNFCSKPKDFEEKRARRLKRKADDSGEPAVALTGRDKFKIVTFYVIVDAIVADLSQRIQVYLEVDGRRSFLYRDSNSTKTTESIKSFVEFYSADVNNELFNDWIHWSSFFKTTSIIRNRYSKLSCSYSTKDAEYNDPL